MKITEGSSKCAGFLISLSFLSRALVPSQRRRMEATAGILTNMLSANTENEVPNTLFAGKRLCAGRMKMSNLSMQDIRRQRESQVRQSQLWTAACFCQDSRRRMLRLAMAAR